MIGFLKETTEVLAGVSQPELHKVVSGLQRVRDDFNGRLFLCGNGGGAAHASHATADFRKVAGFEAYCINDNVAELTARINDDGWHYCYSDWLLASKIGPADAVFVFSVGGGSLKTSINLTSAMDAGKAMGAFVTGIVGAGEHRAIDTFGTEFITIPSTSTPQVEGIQAVLWHYLAVELQKTRSMDFAFRLGKAPAC